MTDPRTHAAARRIELASYRLDTVTAPPGVAVVDLRSPHEFAADHIEGAYNVPLFDDEERAVVGTLYRRNGPQDAYERGIEIVVGKVRELVASVGRAVGLRTPLDGLEDRVRAIADGGAEQLERSLTTRRVERPERGSILLHCWRGGMRSRSVAALLRELGWPVVLLEGGYRAYRRVVHQRVGELEFPRVYVLRGMTGVGKTLVLNAIEELRPGSTVDLEGLADHRSSILGMVGRQPRTQKMFESGLCRRVAAGFPEDWVVFEGESRKVGDVVLPETVWNALTGGESIRLDAPTERRIDVLCDDYLASDGSRAELLRQLPFIEGRLGARWEGELCRMLEDGRERELVAHLLERYYDARYSHSERRHAVAHEVDSSDPAACAAAIVDWIDAR